MELEYDTETLTAKIDKAGGSSSSASVASEAAASGGSEACVAVLLQPRAAIKPPAQRATARGGLDARNRANSIGTARERLASGETGPEAEGGCADERGGHG